MSVDAVAPIIADPLYSFINNFHNEKSIIGIHN